MRSQGILSPLLVRPLTERSFEIVAGARRYRAAQLAEAETVPVRIVNLTDAEALEAQLIENLQRRDVHPLEEAQGFRALLNLDEPKYSIEQIAAKTGKSPAYCAQRVKLTELTAAVTEAFAKDEIGVGHALLLAKLQPAEQEQALSACFREDWNGGQGKAKRILLPVRHLHQWIEQNILLILKDAPFSKTDPNVNPAAGACVDCPKRKPQVFPVGSSPPRQPEWQISRLGSSSFVFGELRQSRVPRAACSNAELPPRTLAEFRRPMSPRKLKALDSDIVTMLTGVRARGVCGRSRRLSI
ncbi:MAG: ParB/RepB/Spo0J family partition protein [Terracidiphilus sp.]